MTIDAEKITVTDTGLGIPEVMMPLLYERFERLNEVNKGDQVEGSGLGLSIVQRITAHMGWQLTHQANKTSGSTFSIYYNNK